MSLKKKRVLIFVILLILFFLSYKLINIYNNKNNITGLTAGGTKGFDADFMEASEMPSATTTPEGVIDVTKSPGTNRILSPTDTSISPLKTNLGTISNARLENHAFNFGDLVQGKMTSFTDNNLISIKSMFDPDMRVEIIMGKDGWAIINQYDKYGRLVNTMTVEMSANNVLREGLGKEFGISDFKPNNDTQKAVYERSEDKARIEAGTLTLTKDDKTEKVTAPTKATKPTEIKLNKESGFECATLQEGGSYSFESTEKSFSITNDNKQDYTVCVNKVEKPIPRPISQRSAYVDQIKDVIDLKMKVTYKYDNKPLYQGFDDKNLAKVESSIETVKFSLENKAPGTKLISEVYTGIYKITETMIKGIVHRGFDYSEERKPILVNLYTSNLGKNYGYGDIRITKDRMLHYYSLDGEEKITMHDPEGAVARRCRELLGEVLTYEHSAETEIEYLEKC